MTGWNLPPGCTTRHIDEAAGVDAPCAICGRAIDDCICQTCHHCGAVGDPHCYAHHGMTRSAFQIASLAEAEARWQAEADADAALWDQWDADYEDDPLGDWHGRNE